MGRDSWKRSRWGGSWNTRSSWRANCRGYLVHSRGVKWGSPVRRLGERWGRADWGGDRARMHGPMKGSLSGSMGGLISGAFSSPQSSRGDGEPGGLLSSLNLGLGRRSRIKIPAVEPFSLDGITGPGQDTVVALAFRYVQAYHDDDTGEMARVSDDLERALGTKCARLVTDWVHQRGEKPDLGECRRFVSMVVEVAAVDGGREPLLWKVQRFLRNLLGRRRASNEPQAA
jgi:hypothetical protein